MSITRVQKKRNALNGFIDDLWTACAEGRQFQVDKTRSKYSLTQAYAKYIMDNCVEKKGIYLYTVKKGQRRRNITEVLSNLPISTVKEAVVRGTNLLAPAVVGAYQAPSNANLRHLAPGDTLLKATRLDAATDVVDKATVKEVKAISKHGVQMEIDDLSGKKLPNSVITLKVMRTYPGGNDSTEFAVSKNLDYNGLLSLVNKFKAV